MVSPSIDGELTSGDHRPGLGFLTASLHIGVVSTLLFFWTMRCCSRWVAMGILPGLTYGAASELEPCKRFVSTGCDLVFGIDCGLLIDKSRSKKGCRSL